MVDRSVDVVNMGHAGNLSSRAFRLVGRPQIADLTPVIVGLSQLSVNSSRTASGNAVLVPSPDGFYTCGHDKVGHCGAGAGPVA